MNAQQQNVTFTVEPSSFNEDDEITITVSNINVSTWGVTDIYLWAWYFNLSDIFVGDAPNNGTWQNSNEGQKLTNNGDNTYSITLTPTSFYNATDIGRIGFLVKAKNGDGDKKSQDNLVEVGVTSTPTIPTVTEAPVPNGMLDGFNLDQSDNTKATLVLYAPDKDFVNLIGNFNNWQRDDTNYLLKKDSAKDRFWIELNGLTPQTNYMYQYLVDGTIRIADPYSTTILSESNDQFISTTTYPNLPSYPTGSTNHAITLLRTGEVPYNWQTTNFQRPAKTDLVIYELLVRDFDALHSFDAVKARLDYLQDLGINAIELMPVNEFDGNESWGYNPSFHMALDKYYGTPTALKQLIDECHKRGIAIILDVVYNHASGQHPFYRLWNTDAGGYNGQASADSPFFNQTATHSYSVFNDFNHSKQATQDYVKRTVQYWIDEYKVDGFRWDLTKGFTQNCTSNDESCTNAFQGDRVGILKEYADYQWAIDPNFYVIFEHLGTNAEEIEWVNYRLAEGKGIMVWGNHNFNYNEATMGYTNTDFSSVSYKERGWTVPANISYMESHDEERLMFKNKSFGNSSGGYSVKNEATALDRQELAGAFYFTIPGPKMIWQFGELGYDISIDQNGRTGNKPILWNYFTESDRKDLYDTWSKLIKFKKQEPIFKTNNFTLDVANTNGLKKIQLTDDTANPTIKHINIIGNFGVTTQSINPDFQESGTWYDFLNDNAVTNVTSTNATISLQPGEFKVFTTSQVTLSINDELLSSSVSLAPNPVKNKFRVSSAATKVSVYDLMGRLTKVFKGAFAENSTYDISELSTAIYIIRIESDLGAITKKIIKE